MPPSGCQTTSASITFASVAHVDMFFTCSDKDPRMSAVWAKLTPYSLPGTRDQATPAWRIWKGSGTCTY